MSLDFEIELPFTKKEIEENVVLKNLLEMNSGECIEIKHMQITSLDDFIHALKMDNDPFSLIRGCLNYISKCKEILDSFKLEIAFFENLKPFIHMASYLGNDVILNEIKGIVRDKIKNTSILTFIKYENEDEN